VCQPRCNWSPTPRCCSVTSPPQARCAACALRARLPAETTC
jgi:hypothetical protein